jgi:hypothetical protein
VHESARSLLVEGSGIDAIDEAIRNDRKYLIEQTRTVACGAFLRDSAARDKRHGDEPDEGEFSTFYHTCLQ